MKRKEQKIMIEAFMKVKTMKKKVVIHKIIKQDSKIVLARCKPALVLLNMVFKKKKHIVFLDILKDIRSKR